LTFIILFLESEDEEEVKYSEDENNGENKSKNINVVQEQVAPGVFTQHRNKILKQTKKDFKDLIFCIDGDGTVECDIKTKLAIVNKLKTINVSRTSRFDKARKSIKWDDVKILEYTSEEVKSIFDSIVKDISRFRTFDEILNDYIENYQKYEVKSCFKEKKPLNPCMKFIVDNREDIEKKMKKKFPGKSIQLVR
jgi:hypothetical protein